VTVAKLTALFSVSIETVRRDLLVLEQGGKLMRVHGGAVAKAGMKEYPTLQQRTKEFRAEKDQLSRVAARFVSEGDIISIDAGSTAVVFAEVLKESFQKLTVVTHSRDVFDLLCDHRDFNLILCGGQYLRGDNAFYGELTLEMLRNLHTQKAFVFPSAVSIEYGICDFQQELYQVQKQLMRSADQVYILADSSKFEKTGLVKLDAMTPEYIYITDASLPREAVSLYRENGLTIYLGGAEA
jgi:DeoR/GlpR family transcriptional regulator of sugar metabolism